MNSNTNILKDLNDRDLVVLAQNDKDKKVKDKAIEVLLQRYQIQINKNWYILRKQFNDSALIRSFEDDYFSKAYEAILTSISKINIDKIYDDKWKLLQYNSFYLKNVRTSIAKLMEKASKVKSLDHMTFTVNGNEGAVDYDVETAYQEKAGYKDNPEYILLEKEKEEETKSIIYKRRELWSEEKKFIFDLFIKGVPEKEIAQKLNKPRSYIYNKISWLKKDLKKAFNIT